MSAARELADRTEGKPRQALDISVEDKKRQLFENAVAALVAETGASRDEAVEQLLVVYPEANQWIN